MTENCKKVSYVSTTGSGSARQAQAHVRQHGDHQGVRGNSHEAVQPRKGARHRSFLRWRGSHRGRRLRGDRAAGSHLCHAPRARAEHRQGDEREDDDGRVPRQGHRRVQGQGWMHAHCRGRSREPRGQRHRGRRDPDRRGSGPQHRDAEDRSDRRLFLRGRRVQRGNVPRVAQPRLDMEASGALRLHQQPVRDVDARPQEHEHRRHLGAGRLLWHAGPLRGRERRGGGLRGGPGSADCRARRTVPCSSS